MSVGLCVHSHPDTLAHLSVQNHLNGPIKRIHQLTGAAVSFGVVTLPIGSPTFARRAQLYDFPDLQAAGRSSGLIQSRRCTTRALGKQRFPSSIPSLS
jgi:hypothetical protein